MRSIIAAAAAALLLTGCAMKLDIPKEEAFTPALRVQDVRINWIRADNPTQECKRLWPKALGNHPFVPACAGWDFKNRTCTIVTGNVTTHQILGHEIRHCFEGAFH